MAAGFLIIRLLLVCVLSEVNYSSAFPRARSSVQPGAWQGGRGDQEVNDYGSHHPLQYMKVLKQTSRNGHPNVRDQVQGLRLYQPRSNVATQRLMETSLPQPRAQRNHPLAKPRSFDFSLNIPFAHTHSTNGRDGAIPYYRPNAVHLQNSFNNPLGYHDVSKPGYQFSISVPVSHASRFPHRRGSQDRHFGGLRRPENIGFSQTEEVYVPVYTEPNHGKQMFPPWYSRQHLEQPDHEVPIKQSWVFSKPDVPRRPLRPYSPKYDGPYNGYYGSQIIPAWNDYWGHYAGPHLGREHPPSDRRPNFQDVPTSDSDGPRRPGRD